jgi:outer membrane lipoprotein-sorting protein
MRNFFLSLIIIFFTTQTFASIKDSIIENLKNTKNFTFSFEQNLNGKVENGNCVIEYPKKIFCKYNLKNNKILVSNGRSLVIKTSSNFYLYPIEKTPLNLILNKNYILRKMINSNNIIIENKIVSFNFTEDENEINIFFDKKTFDLIGWQTIDIFQNLNTTYLNSINKNQALKKNLFKLPTRE